MTIYSNIDINNILLQEKGSIQNPFNETILQDNGKVVSIMGPSKKGKAFYPQGFKNYPDFADVSGDIFTHYKEYQGRINSNFAAYNALNSGGQVNYIRLLGLDHDSFNNKPGFKIGEAGSLTNKIYAFGADFKKKDDADLTRFNYNLLKNAGLTGTSDVYKLKIGYIVTKTGVTIDIANGYNTYKTVSDANSNQRIDINLYCLTLAGLGNSTVDNVVPQNDDLLLDVLDITEKTPYKIYFNFKKTSEYYFEKVFNKNIHRMNDFGYVLYSYQDINDNFSYCIKNDETVSNSTLKYYIEDLSTDDFKNFKKGYTHSTSPWFVSQGFYLKDEIDDRSNLKDRIIKLFRVHSITDGESGNNYFIKIVPNNLGDETQWASFDLHVFDRSIESSRPIESFIDLKLKEDDENYILRRIGDFQNYFDANGSERVVNQGIYPRISKYIWVEVSKDVEMQNIPKETIPGGFIEKRKEKTTSGLQSSNLNIPSMIFDASNGTISNDHSWGHNVFSLNEDNSFTNYKLEKLNRLMKGNNELLTVKSDIIFKVIKQKNISPFKKDKKRYLSDFYFENVEIDNNLENKDIFHVEKIVLLNTKLNGILRQCWELSTYDQKGEILKNLDGNNNENYKYFEELDIDSGNNPINQNDNPFYYFQFSKEKNFINNLPTIDTVEILGNNRHYLSFVAEMSGGFDGLNMFDIDQVAMTHKGIENNSYLRELYQYGLEIMSSREQCLNDIIHLCGIYDEEILKKINGKLDENDYRSKPVYILDKPMYDINENIIDCHQVLQRSQISPPHRWSDFVFEYKENTNIDFDTCLYVWQRKINDSSYVSSFANYMKIEIKSGGGLGFDQRKSYDIIVPSSVLAINKILNDNLLVGITDNETISSDLEGNNISQFLTRLDESDSKFEFLKKEYSRYTTNVLYSQKSPMTGVKFYTSKTNSFIDNSNNQSLRSVLLYRLILNEVKRNAANLGIREIFRDVKSKKETILRYNQIYTALMNSIVNQGIIAEYVLKLDEYSTSEEDILNNTIRGEIYIRFNGQSNFITNSSAQNLTVKI